MTNHWMCLAALVFLPACYGSSEKSYEAGDVFIEPDLVAEHEDMIDSSSDDQGSDVLDVLVDQDDEELDLMDEQDSSDAQEDEPPPVLVPEGPEVLYPTDTGRNVRPTYASIAFSGSIYSLILFDDQHDPALDPVGLFRLAPGGEFLEMRWISSFPDHDPDGPDYVGLCWSGETFFAAFAEDEEGIFYVSMFEDGTMAHDQQLLVDDPDSELDVWWRTYPLLACPDGGPMVFDMRQSDEGLERLYLFQNNGMYENRYVDSSLDTHLAYTSNSTYCTIVEHEVACIGEVEHSDHAGIVFTDREGRQRYSEPLPGEIRTSNFYMYGGTITQAGDYIAIIGITADTEENKFRLLYALYDREGWLIVPPVSDALVGYNRYGMRSASSGSNILVQAAMYGEEYPPPHLYLLDLEGHAMGSSHPLTDTWVDDPHQVIGIFWEGDAYAVLWTHWQGVMYRRFRVE
jgi:hypothetical protein